MRPDPFLPPPPATLQKRLESGAAVAWEQHLEIPTYEPGRPEELPMYLDRRVYQGSSGRVYPLPVIDSIADHPTPHTWQAIHLENRWLRLVVLPELGGRIHVAYDKAAGYDLFYRNTVIKPALVGLTGPWISGGVEFNWPQHHRPATFLPVDTTIEEHDDGAVTVWCSDHDPFARMKGMHGIRLRPDSAAIEVVVRLHNRTSDSQTFLWWANVAAKVHDDYQSFFPTDVRYVADHARRAITAFPAADRPYYGVDYPARAGNGGDRIDFYRNIPVPTSYMVTDTEDDFFGGYDHRAEVGFVHVADRHIAPGKKQWTWGDAPFGHAWDRQLTDADGPYVELMAGVYTDNQPDFAWLAPGETKTFTQTWFPIHGIGPAHQATTDAAVHLELVDGAIVGGVAVATVRQARVTIAAGDRTILDETVSLEPGRPFRFTVAAPSDHLPDYELAVTDGHGDVIRWRPRDDAPDREPWTASAPPLPQDIAGSDELYITGLHLSQNRHPSRSPLPYWNEAIRRDPLDSRANTAVADHRLRHGRYAEAETHILRALERQTRRNGNPRDGEARYLHGLILIRLGRTREAIDALAKAAWDLHWVAPAHLEIARLHAAAGNDRAALESALKAAEANSGDSRVTALRVILQRRLGNPTDAEGLLSRLLEVDPLDQTGRALAGLPTSVDGRTLLDVAGDLAAAGETEHALRLLADAAQTRPGPSGNVLPLAHYYRARLLRRLGRNGEADSAVGEARRADPRWCFPVGLDDHDVLRDALTHDDEDQVAASLLATLLYDAGRSHEALDLWRSVIDAGEADAATYRNAAVASVPVLGHADQALEWYDRALQLHRSARLLHERDQLLAVIGADATRRLRLLRPDVELVVERDDLTISFVNLLLDVGDVTGAHAVLASRSFAPWEGGEGLALAAWERATAALSEAAEHGGDAAEALRWAEAALTPPVTLGEARHPLAPTARIRNRIADLLERDGRPEAAGIVRAHVEAAALSDRQSVPDATADYFATSLPEFALFRMLPSGSTSEGSADGGS
ncbi:DUF5107 domain-containing protein [Leifsonia aquatica]|uniref:DUF5107 domain-containing protein n=1 Tax=Leifsonia aquatica TaxID=144185 RepID=UPI00046B04ED|nr:DUF5107 domain-containing protein [Leifsonia aquatica]